MTQTKTAFPISGLAPLTVTYTYRLTNDGGVAIKNVTVTDDHCSPLSYTSGDAGNDNILGIGEVWTYTCTKTYPEAGTYPNTAVANGTTTTGKSEERRGGKEG